MRDPMMKVLLIDDDVNLSKVITYQLEKNGHQVSSVHRGLEGLARFETESFDLILSDIQMPDITGIQVLQEIRRKNRQVIIILITAYGSVENALEACRMGADDYITKPFGQEQLLFVIEKAIRIRKLQQENVELRKELSGKIQFDRMVVTSTAMERIMQIAGKVAQSDATVLLLGESGTGKELLARAIHHHSPRKEKSFVVVNCPSIPENLLESELFGHVRGAYTGAIKDRKGKFELADQGTLFLDEIGDLRENIQAKLLRVLQEQEFERLGDSRTIQVNVRLIAATNKNIEKLIEQGRFREDLYYRLSVVPITLPPLRQRPEDIPYLIDHFIKKYSKGKTVSVNEEVYAILGQYQWPGNIRELENLIERMLVLTSEPRITADQLPPHLISGVIPGKKEVFSPPSEDFSLENIERNAIELALQKTGGNQTRAARLLKIPRHVLLYRLKKWQIKT